MAAEEAAKYARIADDLRSDIRSGKRVPGSRLPSRPELERFYGVASGTVDKALRLLVSESMIYTEHGVGSFVSDPLPEEAASEFTKIMQRLDEMEAQIRQQAGRIDELEQQRLHEQ